MKKNIGVIGAGISGISIMHALKKQGLSYTCFESREDLGGLWNYSNTAPSIYESCIHNHLRTHMQIHDYDSDSSVDFFSHREYFKYLQTIPQKNICFNSSVQNVEYIDNLWSVKTPGKSYQFTHIINCTGYYNHPFMPDYFDNCKIPYFHSKDYRSADNYDIKKVLIIGAGNSGVQIAEDFAKKNIRVDISSKGNILLIPRYIGDEPFLQWYQENQNTDESTIINKIRTRFTQDEYGLKTPKGGLLSANTIPIFNNLDSYLENGLVTFKDQITSIDNTTVQFSSNEYVDDYDLVIVGTGYIEKYPHFDFNTDDKIDHMYSKVHPNLFFVGAFQPIGAVPPVLRLQSNIISKLINFDHYPTTKNEIKLSKRILLSQYLTYMNERYSHVLNLQHVTV
jgi:dimethylaniline monooxygenase (N-oxide forming)